MTKQEHAANVIIAQQAALIAKMHSALLSVQYACGNPQMGTVYELTRAMVEVREALSLCQEGKS